MYALGCPDRFTAVKDYTPVPQSKACLEARILVKKRKAKKEEDGKMKKELGPENTEDVKEENRWMCWKLRVLWSIYDAVWLYTTPCVEPKPWKTCLLSSWHELLENYSAQNELKAQCSRTNQLQDMETQLLFVWWGFSESPQVLPNHSKGTHLTSMQPERCNPSATNFGHPQCIAIRIPTGKHWRLQRWNVLIWSP